VAAPARWGEATASSDIDLLVELVPGGGNELMRLAAIGEELSMALGRRVDVVASSLLRDEVSGTALDDAVDPVSRSTDQRGVVAMRDDVHALDAGTSLPTRYRKSHVGRVFDIA